jgi:hypothetical protein
MDPNPDSPPAHNPATVAASARRPRNAAAISVALAVPLMIVGLLQMAAWLDHLENVSLLSDHPEMVETVARERAMARAGQAATLLHLLLGAALIPLAIRQARRRRGARRTTLVVAILAMTLSAAVGGLLLWAGENSISTLFLVMPALLAGAAEYFAFSRFMPSSRVEPAGRPPAVE